MQPCVIGLASSERLNGCLLLTQVEELYEAYCLQRRLRDGANKMVKAYTTSPGSKEARESLAEANRGYKEYTEVGATQPGRDPPRNVVSAWFRQPWPFITEKRVQNSYSQSQVLTVDGSV